jgi:hypothetical protein
MDILQLSVIVRVAEDIAFVIAHHQIAFIPADGVFGK